MRPARRSGKTINGNTTNFLYDGVNAVQELAGSPPTANLLMGHGIDEVFSFTDGFGTRSRVTDALGSTVALTDGSGVDKTSYTYEPYGNTIASGEASITDPNGNVRQVAFNSSGYATSTTCITTGLGDKREER